jgi:hypothetical protein
MAVTTTTTAALAVTAMTKIYTAATREAASMTMTTMNR